MRFTWSKHLILLLGVREGVQPEEVFICGSKQSPKNWFEQFASVFKAFGPSRSKKDHSVFWRQYQKKRLFLIVYVVNIIIITDDGQQIADLKCYLLKHFQTKELRSLWYFLEH